MKMNAIIIEDEYPAQKELERLCQESKLINITGIYEDVTQAADNLTKENIDLIFLDVIANDTDNNIETLIDLCDEKLVIITTGYKEHAYNSFKINTVDLLEKPIDKKSFQTAVNKAYRKHQKEIESYLVIKNYRIPFDNIAYIVSGKNLNNDIYSKNPREKYIVFKKRLNDVEQIRVNDNALSFDKIEKCLPKNCFLRVNKASIIAVDMILERRSKDLIILKDGKEFSVGAAYIENVNRIF